MKLSPGKILRKWRFLSNEAGSDTGLRFWGGETVFLLCSLMIIFEVFIAVLDFKGLNGYEDSSGFEHYVYIWSALFMLNIFVFVPVWIYQSHSNLPKFNSRYLKFTSVKIGRSCLMPFINLFYMPRVISEVWRAGGFDAEFTTDYTPRRDIRLVVIWLEIISIFSFFVVPNVVPFNWKYVRPLEYYLLKFGSMSINNLLTIVLVSMLEAQQKGKYCRRHPEIAREMLDPLYQRLFDRWF